MPSPKRRAKQQRGFLSDPEIAELLAGGPAPDQPSAFVDASAFLRARARLAVEREDWDALDAWRHEAAAIDLRFRRHMAHSDRVPLADPAHPAIVDTARCRLCQRAAERWSQ